MFFRVPALNLFLLLTLYLSSTKGQDEQWGAANTSRLLNGVDAMYPPTFLVSIQRVTGTERMEHVCGGVIVGLEYILTAATCVHHVNFSRLRVLAGVRNLSSNMGSSRSIVDHVDVGEMSRGNNLAVVRVAPAFTLNDRITVAEMPKESVIKTGDTVHLYGWGKIDPSGRQSTLTLKQLETRVISSSYCHWLYKELYPNALCTFISLGKGICLGDAGGPAILARTNELVAIISNGVLHCGSEFPDVSTLISPNVELIIEAMAEMGDSQDDTQ